MDGDRGLEQAVRLAAIAAFLWLSFVLIVTFRPVSYVLVAAVCGVAVLYAIRVVHFRVIDATDADHSSAR
ncbi:hypothetical protein [Natronobiforma cellulositropha]|uniref:hypothetical protein n=1 Tax=Natronobiforma cellulositropha TaxID=1679076 RepID=UPI0021D5C787|nr:hypothetical protein [Natronobiforma cellulositropha]